MMTTISTVGGIRPAVFLLVALAGPAVAPPAQTQKWLVEGTQHSDFLGRSLAAVDDLDGDGRKDLIVGIPSDANGVGRVVVLSGSTGAVIRSFAGGVGELFGRSVADAGDVDNDGTTDIIVGALLADYARVYSGKPGPVVVLRTLQGGGGQRFGRSVAGAGDVDGDGHGDVIVGAYFASPGGKARAGRAIVYSGKTGAILLEFEGAVANDQLGTSVAGPGDVNRDGTPDLLVGAATASAERGTATVYSGVDGAILHTFDASPGGNIGYAGVGAGDVNQDGCVDFLIGVPTARDFRGEARVYSGLDGALLHRFASDELILFFGEAVASAGDVDGDGVPDLLVGGSANDGAGVARVFSGSSGVPLFEVTGVAGSSLGMAVAGLGDLDGDGLSDVAIASPLDPGSNGVFRSGLVQAFTSPQPGPAADPNLSTIAANPTSVGFLGESTVTAIPKDAAGVKLGPGHRVFFKTSGGTMVGDVIDHQDGSYTQVLQAGFDATPSTASVAVNGRFIANTVVVTPTAPTFVSVAEMEFPVEGHVGGSFLDTRSADFVSQRISEDTTSGKPSTRYSHLEHKWRLSVPAGNSTLFFLKAYGRMSSDGEAFEFAYSLNDSNYVAMLTVDEPGGASYQTYSLPSSISGSVYVRVRDTDRTAGNAATNSIRVDHMGIAVMGGTLTPPPSPSSLTASAVSSNRIDLTWTDNAVDEDGFRIERSLDGSSFSPLATVAANVTEHSDLGLSAKTLYYYRVLAYNTAGDSSPSNTASATTLQTGGTSDDIADADIAVQGTVTGNYTATTASGGSVQSIRERESGGKPAHRHSYLEHKWTIDVTGGSSVVFYLNAFHDVSPDLDDFVFAYSTDGNAYTDMLTVTKTVADNTYQSYALPSSTSGTVYIRVRDTNRARGSRALDSIHVDHMFVRSTN